MPAATDARRLAIEWLTVILVVVASVVGLVLSAPIGSLVDRGAVNVVLFVLVFAAALTLPLRSVVELRSRAPRLLLVLAASSVALPVLAWLAAHLVAPGPVRLGVITVGVAPAEIATVALTTLALGETADAAALLVASTLLAALASGPLLALFAGGAELHTGDLVTTMVVVVVLPFVLGGVVRRWMSSRGESLANGLATAAVVVLVALVASQVTLDATLARAGLALVVFIAASAALGVALGHLTDRDDRSAVLLSVSMRDFAIAAGIAAAAFGPLAAAPLGIYGILVMIWGSIAATRARRSRA